jgi:hypothetical protein
MMGEDPPPLMDTRDSGERRLNALGEWSMPVDSCDGRVRNVTTMTMLVKMLLTLLDKVCRKEDAGRHVWPPLDKIVLAFRTRPFMCKLG